ncbi:MAG: replicative DNA helicase [Succinivibrio sp.]|uniref:Replicative DNA helicase n=1 Tax=Succinivibrio faecicola TaxID=2820300 RepID=A0ABS7DJ52_9GAMM|nr:replicative DNA helicase [Succinivibrio faecicola]MBW7570875.1 replicative DNA helicase [Succinivibrio faecicola]MCI6938674.1 replicative DNA helicase [Succinatimonas hippei]
MAEKKNYRQDQEILNTLKEMPKNEEAERNFLGALLTDGKLLEKVRENVGMLDSKDFFSEKHRIIYEQILKRAATTDDFNPLVLSAELETAGTLDKAGGAPYIASLQDITSPVAAIAEYAKIIRDTARRRRLITVCQHIEKICYLPESRSVEDIYDEAQGLVYEVSEARNAGQNSGPKQMTEVAIELIEQIKSDMNSNKQMHGVATGFRELDELTSGLRGGTLNIIAARPGVGKTSFAMNIVANIAMDLNETRPALVFSLEMPAKEIATRMLSSFGRVSGKDLVSGKASADQWHRIIQKVRLLTRKDESNQDRSMLYIDDTSDIALTPLELRSRARKIALDNGGLSVIMVDYIQLMKSQTKLENRAQEVGEISRSLKQLSKELDVPILALAQLNREVEGRKDHRPMNSDLRESGSLEQDADMIMFIHRDDVYKAGNDGDGKATLIVSKNRNGSTKDIELQFQGAYTTFYNKDEASSYQDDIPLPDNVPYQ